jgi:hypothetical protein
VLDLLSYLWYRPSMHNCTESECCHCHEMPLIYKSVCKLRPKYNHSKLLSRIPRHRSPNPTQSTQFPISQFHRTKLNHSRIKAQSFPNLILYLTRGVESHDEVMSLRMCSLMFACSFREAEDSPVLDASYRTSRVDDEGARCACDTGVVSKMS